MTVRVIPLETAMMDDAPTSTVLIVDDADQSVQRIDADFEQDKIIAGDYAVLPARTDVRDKTIKDADSLLDGLVAFGLTNTMYGYNEDDVRDFKTKQEAVDYVFTEIWEEES